MKNVDGDAALLHSPGLVTVQGKQVRQVVPNTIIFRVGRQLLYAGCRFI